MQRTDLNPIEEATGYSELIEKFGYTQEQVSEVIGKSRSYLTNMMRLLKLPQPVQGMLQAGKLTAGHARCLSVMRRPNLSPSASWRRTSTSATSRC